MLPPSRQSLPGSPKAIPLRLFLLEIYSIAYSTAILQCTGTRSCPTSTLIALSSFSRTILDKTLNPQLAAPVTVLHVLPAQCGLIKNAGQEGQDAEKRGWKVQKASTGHGAKETFVGARLPVQKAGEA